MMKKLILVTFLTLLVLVAPASAAQITLNFSSTNVNVGDTFTVEVRLTNTFENVNGETDVISAFGFNTAISDPALAQFVSALVNPLFSDDSALFNGNPQVAGTTVDPFGVGQGVITEPFTLATLTFQALAPGQVNIGTLSDIDAPSQGLLFLLNEAPFVLVDSLSNEGLVVTINEAPVSNDIPEPSTWVLLGSSLGFLGLARRCRKA
jgi:hypothetical protein